MEPVLYSCGCFASGDNVHTHCPMHNSGRGISYQDYSRLKAELEKLRGDYSALAQHHDAAHSDVSRKELENEIVLANSLLDVVNQIADGKEPDDFSQYFPVIRKLYDYILGLKAELERLNKTHVGVVTGYRDRLIAVKAERDQLRAKCERLAEAGRAAADLMAELPTLNGLPGLAVLENLKQALDAERHLEALKEESK